MNVIDEYISQFSGEVKERLGKIRETIKKAAPDATEKISWQMPTFYQKGNLIHFAAAKKHIGIYPGANGVACFAKELEGYKTSKGAIQFQNSEPVPYDLISRIVKFRVRENTEE